MYNKLLVWTKGRACPTLYVGMSLALAALLLAQTLNLPPQWDKCSQAQKCGHDMWCVLCAADVVAGRKTAGELTGQVLVGGKPPSRMFMRRYTGYVEQFGAAFIRS